MRNACFFINFYMILAGVVFRTFCLFFLVRLVFRNEGFVDTKRPFFENDWHHQSYYKNPFFYRIFFKTSNRAVGPHFVASVLSKDRSIFRKDPRPTSKDLSRETFVFNI